MSLPAKPEVPPPHAAMPTPAVARRWYTRWLLRGLAALSLLMGVAGVFIETHPDPDHAPSDGPNMVVFKEFPALIENLLAYDALTKKA